MTGGHNPLVHDSAHDRQTCPMCNPSVQRTSRVSRSASRPCERERRGQTSCVEATDNKTYWCLACKWVAKGAAAPTVRPMPVESDLSRRLRRAARKIEQATAERDALILEALAAGGSTREVAALVGLTHAGVLDIKRRKGRT